MVERVQPGPYDYVDPTWKGSDKTVTDFAAFRGTNPIVYLSNPTAANIARSAGKSLLNETSVRSGDSLFGPSTEDFLKDEKITVMHNRAIM